MMEKNYLKNERNFRLSYVLNNGKPSAPILLLLHGFAGNKDENGLFIEAEDYFSSKNFNVFRFDVEGAGESEGDYSLTSLRKQSNDLESTIDYLTKTYPESKIGVVGFSLGATVSILLNDSRIDAYGLWSPALSPSEDMFPRYNTEEIRERLKSDGFLDKAGLKVGSAIINDLRDCKLQQNIQEINKPVLLIHGTADDKINYKTTNKFQNLFNKSKMVLIEGANHSYKNNPLHRHLLFRENYSFFSNVFCASIN